MDERIIYHCRDNENSIKMLINNWELDEFQFGCYDLEKDGWTVIGFDDLVRALSEAGYELLKRK